EVSHTIRHHGDDHGDGHGGHDGPKGGGSGPQGGGTPVNTAPHAPNIGDVRAFDSDPRRGTDRP
ncbi:hypothetical protein, partial [Luteibacter yeojuensis]